MILIATPPYSLIDCKENSLEDSLGLFFKLYTIFYKSILLWLDAKQI